MTLQHVCDLCARPIPPRDGERFHCEQEGCGEDFCGKCFRLGIHPPGHDVRRVAAGGSRARGAGAAGAGAGAGGARAGAQWSSDDEDEEDEEQDSDRDRRRHGRHHAHAYSGDAGEEEICISTYGQLLVPTAGAGREDDQARATNTAATLAASPSLLRIARHIFRFIAGERASGMSPDNLAEFYTVAGHPVSDTPPSSSGGTSGPDPNNNNIPALLISTDLRLSSDSHRITFPTLRRLYRRCHLDFILILRTVTSSAISPPLPQQQIPLLTLTGFTALLVLHLLADPAAGVEMINRVLSGMKDYTSPLIPREAAPARADEAVRRRWEEMKEEVGREVKRVVREEEERRRREWEMEMERRKWRGRGRGWGDVEEIEAGGRREYATAAAPADGGGGTGYRYAPYAAPTATAERRMSGLEGEAAQQQGRQSYNPSNTAPRRPPATQQRAPPIPSRNLSFDTSFGFGPSPAAAVAAGFPDLFGNLHDLHDHHHQQHHRMHQQHHHHHGAGMGNVAAEMLERMRRNREDLLSGFEGFFGRMR